VNSFGLVFEHFGLAVRAPQSAFRFLEALGYTEGKQVFDPEQQVNLAMRYHRDMPAVEVVWPGEGPSPIDKLVKRGGSMIYHLCYACPDPEDAVRRMQSAGLDVLAVVPAKPAVLFGGRRVSFYNVGEVGLIELIERGPE
jgi:hypothetical protein